MILLMVKTLFVVVALFTACFFGFIAREFWKDYTGRP